MTAKEQDYIVVGKISSPYGVKGWVKLFSYTDPVDNILQYRPWFIKQKGVWKDSDDPEKFPTRHPFEELIEGQRAWRKWKDYFCIKRQYTGKAAL